ncbi:MAG: hypothetical protein RR618_03560 [Cellulosilyticaceae bacterium]
MWQKVSCLFKFILKVFLVVGITSLILFMLSYFLEFSLESLFFVVGVIYFIIGGSTVLGDSDRRVDVNYLQTRSLSLTKSWDEVAENKKEVDHGASFILLMIISGILLIGLTYYF